jgi:hypothetical protein
MSRSSKRSYGALSASEKSPDGMLGSFSGISKWNGGGQRHKHWFIDEKNGEEKLHNPIIQPLASAV